MSSKGNRKLIHGSLEGYKSFGCRCKKCSNIWAVYTEQFREEIFDDRNAEYGGKVNVTDSDIERGYNEYKRK